jgi:hypothetical protein
MTESGLYRLERELFAARFTRGCKITRKKKVTGYINSL